MDQIKYGPSNELWAAHPEVVQLLLAQLLEAFGRLIGQFLGRH